MIDIEKLHRLAQAATPGPWFTWEGGVYAGRPKVKKRGELRGYDAKICEMDDMDGTTRSRKANARLIAAANPAVISELLDRLEAAEKSDAESIAMYRKARDESDALRAKVEAMEKQEPHSYIYRYWNPLDGSPVWRHEPGNWNGQQPGACAPLYALPGAQQGK